MGIFLIVFFKKMNTHWFYTMPGVVITAILVWPLSRRDSEGLFERVRFCLFSMLGVAFLVWGCQKDFDESVGWLTVIGPVIAMMAGVFLVLFWLEKFSGKLTNLSLYCFFSPDDVSWGPEMETKLINTAFEQFWRGERQRALRLCHLIIKSNSQYASTASTLAYWIEHPGGLRLIESWIEHPGGLRFIE
jgi:purine-cytosine permease-like protein